MFRKKSCGRSLQAKNICVIWNISRSSASQQFPQQLRTLNDLRSQIVHCFIPPPPAKQQPLRNQHLRGKFPYEVKVEYKNSKKKAIISN
ncbi:hypothetical protein ACIPF8_06875 [Collimonas sp. NPDC087041]|uniref:hypothetical protein n=1 Tax=Collimonas sp. NPDC087041 TaxID=3363960 RepID=UPI0038213C17